MSAKSAMPTAMISRIFSPPDPPEPNSPRDAPPRYDPDDEPRVGMGNRNPAIACNSSERVNFETAI
jgi:hypothetical protein